MNQYAPLAQAFTLALDTGVYLLIDTEGGVRRPVLSVNTLDQNPMPAYAQGMSYAARALGSDRYVQVEHIDLRDAQDASAEILSAFGFTGTAEVSRLVQAFAVAGARLTSGAVPVLTERATDTLMRLAAAALSHVQQSYARFPVPELHREAMDVELD